MFYFLMINPFPSSAFEFGASSSVPHVLRTNRQIFRHSAFLRIHGLLLKITRLRLLGSFLLEIEKKLWHK